MRLIPINKLRVNDIVARPIIDDFGRVLIAAGAKIKTPEILNRLAYLNINAVYIQDEWSADIFVEPVIDQEVAFKAVSALAKMDVERVRRSASLIVDRLTSSPQLYDDMQSIKEYDEYTFNHSLNVAIASTTLGVGLGYGYNRLKNIATGALLHDVGKQLVPIEIINKKGKLTPEEFDIVKRHPEDGYRILRGNTNVTSSIREIAHQHHENWDGSGYPRHLKGGRIYELAHVVHICDVYDALASKRSYKEAFPVSKIINILDSGRGTQFNPRILDAFYKYVPIYPKGAEVILNTNETALIYENNRGNMLRPKIMLGDKRIIDLRDSDLEIIS